MITQIIYDLDGTLFDSIKILIKIGNEIVVKHGYEALQEDKIKEIMRLPMKKRIDCLKIPMHKLPKMGVEILSAFKSHTAEVKLIEGVREMLECLREQGYGLSIVSSNSVDNIQTLLKANNLNVFNHIQSSKGLFSKHSTISKLISKLNVSKEQVIYIGDEQRDVEACKKVGIKIISVLWGFDSYELIKKAEPDFIVSNPNEITDIIKTIK